MTAIASGHPYSDVPGLSPVARVSLFHNMAQAEPVWRQIETSAGNLLTPYQRFDFLDAWQAHVGKRQGVTPLIAVGFDRNDHPICLWPLGVENFAGSKVARFLGGKHANFNSLIWRRDVAVDATEASLAPLFDTLAADADALILLNQPFTWQGIANPLACLPHSASADPVMSGILSGDFTSLMYRRMSTKKRKKLRNRTRVLSQHGEIVIRRAQCPTQTRVVLHAFQQQKAERMREFGVPNVFAEAGVAEFLAQATAGPAAPIELYALYAGDRIAATCGGIVANGRFSTMFNSIARDEMAQGSPGRIILSRLVEHLCQRGITSFDLGVGETQYKDLFCDDVEPLFDNFLPLTPSGRLIAGAMAAVYAAKRSIKQTPVLWSTVKSARRLRSILS
jgi:CelD/BcsL family acetyltransferase involved in cellulose biosynthesis